MIPAVHPLLKDDHAIKHREAISTDRRTRSMKLGSNAWLKGAPEVVDNLLWHRSDHPSSSSDRKTTNGRGLQSARMLYRRFRGVIPRHNAFEKHEQNLLVDSSRDFGIPGGSSFWCPKI